MTTSCWTAFSSTVSGTTWPRSGQRAGLNLVGIFLEEMVKGEWKGDWCVHREVIVMVGDAGEEGREDGKE